MPADTEPCEEEQLRRIALGWRQYDWALFRAAQPKVQPSLYVRDWADWFYQRRATALTYSDQIPVWLRPGPGKLLTSVVRLAAAQAASKVRRRLRQKGSSEDAGAAQAQPVHTTRVSPGTAPRWRVSFIARQAICHYFDPSQDPQGRIQLSILVVHGTHCRLENITEEGLWKESETFQYMQQTIKREAGQPVPAQLMKGFRKLRTKRPDLFQGEVLVRQQPAAICDSIIYHWQQRLEHSEFPQSLDQVDAFAGAWTETADETAFLTNRLRSCVPASCTGLVQLTDVGLAMPAKSALSRFQEELRDLMRAKAAAEGTVPTYRASQADVLDAALAMHRLMHRQNESRQTVLRTARQCGWLHFRPDADGKLQPVASQEWAKHFPEGHSKLKPEWLADRGRYVMNGEPEPLPVEGEAPEGVSPSQVGCEQLVPRHLETGLVSPETGCHFEMPVHWEMSEEDVEKINYLLQHPRERESVQTCRGSKKSRRPQARRRFAEPTAGESRKGTRKRWLQPGGRRQAIRALRML